MDIYVLAGLLTTMGLVNGIGLINNHKKVPSINEKNGEVSRGSLKTSVDSKKNEEKNAYDVSAVSDASAAAADAISAAAKSVVAALEKQRLEKESLVSSGSTKSKVVDETKSKVVDETKSKVVDETKSKVIDETKSKVVDETKSKVVDEKKSTDDIHIFNIETMEINPIWEGILDDDLKQAIINYNFHDNIKDPTFTRKVSNRYLTKIKDFVDKKIKTDKNIWDEIWISTYLSDPENVNYVWDADGNYKNVKTPMKLNLLSLTLEQLKYGKEILKMVGFEGNPFSELLDYKEKGSSIIET
jgi:hypothetical protein